jgi:hypothetical protein
VIALGVPHHATQRGNAQRFILSSDADRVVYLELLREYSALHNKQSFSLKNKVNVPSVPPLTLPFLMPRFF